MKCCFCFFVVLAVVVFFLSLSLTIFFLLRIFTTIQEKKHLQVTIRIQLHKSIIKTAFVKTHTHTHTK